MLNEIRDVTQYEPGKLRRWFHDDYFDLYTWESVEGELQGFQLCYAKLGQQRALRWSPEQGYSHEGVDEPEDKPGRSMSALFVADGAFDAGSVGTIFENAALEMPEKFRNFVLERVRAYEQL